MKQERKIELDVLRGLAIFAVVLIHSIDFVYRSPGTSIWLKNLYLVLDQTLRFCVPLFVALSGFVLTKIYSDNLDLLSFFKKRIFRLLPAYIFCSLLVFLFLRMPTIWFQRETYSWFEILVLGKADYPFYFVPMVVQLYLLFPIIIFLSKKHRNLVLVSAFLIQTCTIVFFSYQNETLKVWGPNFTDLKQYFFFGSWIFYFVSGSYFAAEQSFLKKIRPTLLILTLFGLCWTILNSFFMLKNEFGILAATRFTRLPVMLYCSSLIAWLFLKPESVAKLPKFVTRIFSILGKDSYYIYLIHTVVLRILLMELGSFAGSNLLVLSVCTILFSEVIIRSFLFAINFAKNRVFIS